MKKRFLFFGLFILFVVMGYSQELTVTSVVPNGSVGNADGQWPTDIAGLVNVSSSWNSVLKKFKTVQLKDDPFSPDELVQRIGSRAWNAAWAQGDSFTRHFGQQAYTVYLTMGNRKFICFLYNALSNTQRYWFWIYEVI